MKEINRRKKTLMLSIFFSSFGPVVTLIAFFMNTSTTQFADLFRRTAELFVLIVAYKVFVLSNLDSVSEQKVEILEKRQQKLVGGVLFLSAMTLLVLLIYNLLNPAIPSGNVLLGLSIALLGILFNGTFWIRYMRFDQTIDDMVMRSQANLYRAKTIVDVSVFIVLGSVIIFEGNWLTYYIDVVGTMVIIGYLLFNGTQMIKKAH